jgi:hypothetical protein
MAGKTLHSLAFELEVNTKKFTKGMNLSKTELNLMKREMRALLTPAEKMEVKMAKLEQLAKKDAKAQALYTEALKRSNKQMKDTAKAAGGLKDSITKMAAAYVTFQTASRLGRGFLNQIDKLAQLDMQAERTGLSVEKLSTVQFIANRQAGLSAEQTADALDDMMEKMGEAIAGAGEGFGALKEQLGMTEKEIRRIANLRPDAMWEEVRQALKGAQSEAVRLTAANKIFGSNGKALASVLGMQNSAYEEQIQLAKELGAIRNEQQTKEARRVKAQLDAANAEIQRLMTELAIASAPAASTAAEMLEARREGQKVQQPGALPGEGIMEWFTRFGKKYAASRMPFPTASDSKRAAALEKKRAEEERKSREELSKVFRMFNRFKFSPSSAIQFGTKQGQGFIENLQKQMGQIHLRLPAQVARETQIVRTQTGPLSSAAAGSSEAFQLLNRTATVQTIEVQLAKKRTDAAVQTVTLLGQMKNLMEMNPWQQKEYNENLEFEQ